MGIVMRATAIPAISSKDRAAARPFEAGCDQHAGLGYNSLLNPL